jgi:hypothetical protein
MATQPTVIEKRTRARDIFYVVRQWCLPSVQETVTVLHEVPKGAEELAAFDNPMEAIDFAEAAVWEEQGVGSLVELVDPPYGLVGAG